MGAGTESSSYCARTGVRSRLACAGEAGEDIVVTCRSGHGNRLRTVNIRGIPIEAWLKAA